MTQLRSFIGAITFYRDMFPRRSHVLAPLTELVGSNRPKSTKLVWTDKMRKSFNMAKALLSKYTFMRYPDHNKPF